VAPESDPAVAGAELGLGLDGGGVLDGDGEGGWCDASASA
jgi:hypothetical protein